VPGRLTLENFSRIQAGMTEAEVRVLLGKPAQVMKINLPDNPFTPGPRPGAAAKDGPAPKKGADSVLRFVFWKHGRNEARLTFSDGVLLGASATFRAGRAELAAGARNVTEENFKRLRYGMPEADVRLVLGPPAFASLAGISEKEAAGGALFRWRKGRDVIEVTCANGALRYAAGTFRGKTRRIEKPGVKHITRAAYDAVKVGMSMKEVQRLLGPGQLIGPQVTRDGRTSEDTVRFTDGPVFIECHFVNGRLIAKDGYVLPES
jgi:outer membrane protein assembly factor BamE (lipoprotein component of BamABCDE complex)